MERINNINGGANIVPTQPPGPSPAAAALADGSLGSLFIFYMFALVNVAHLI